jgi:type I restriction enzyme S subunit
MDGKQLKNSILQWAIQGKLVPQNPKDESAQKLLERIAAARNEYSAVSACHPERSAKGTKSKDLKKKTSKNPPSRIYRENGVWYEQIGTATPKDISEDIPFEIPENWAWCRLNHLTELIEDCPHSTASNEGSGYPLIRTPNIGFGRLDLRGVHRVSEDVYNKRNARAIPQSGDLIFAREAPAGNIAVIQEGEIVCLGQRTVLIRPKKDLLNADYLAFYILSPISQQMLVGKSTGTTVAHVNLADFRPYFIALPPLAEQKRIVAKLEQVLPLVDEYNAAQEQLDKLNKELPEALKKSILQQAIQGKLVPQNPKDEPAQKLIEKIRKEKQELVKQGVLKKSSLDEIPIDEDGKIFDIPESWAWCNLSMIAETMLGKTKSPQKDKGKPQPYLCSINVYWEGIRLDTIKEMPFSDSEKVKYAVRKGDLLICEGGECGRAAIWEKDDEIFYQNALHRVRFYKGIDAHYFRWCLYLYKNAGWLNEHIKGETIKHLVQNELDSIVFPLPPLAEQKRIVTKLEQLFKVL